MLPTLRDLSPSRAAAHEALAPRIASGATLRPLHALEEFQACFTLQADVWGAAFADIVPASLLQVSTHVGGLVLGAFHQDRLVGFVFGLTGVKDDEIVHWSHMLAVRAEARVSSPRPCAVHHRCQPLHTVQRTRYSVCSPGSATNAVTVGRVTLGSSSASTGV